MDTTRRARRFPPVTTASGSGHNIHLDRPDLVIEATRRPIALAR
jgi:pimeloyl-ACP methyl ester carboxylesterase